MKKIILKPGTLSLSDLRMIATRHVMVELDKAAYKKIEAGKKVVDKIIRDKKTVYSINTGFGALAKVRITEDKFEMLQRNIVLSHAAGVGEALPEDVVRMILILKINTLAQGHSGVRREVVDFLLKLYNAGVSPSIPAKGSVGASGDLAPLAHMSLPLLGVGKVRVKGKLQDTKTVLKKLKLKPLHLAPKEGLALLNGTQV